MGKTAGSFSFKPNHSLLRALDGSIEKGIVLAAEHILGESNKAVPIEEGTLQASGTVAYDAKNRRAAISYDTPYAIVQHEDMSLRHDKGREAKFLENAMNSERETAAKIIANTIKSASKSASSSQSRMTRKLGKML
ncbi:hypothetical protein [Glutamicibacter sp.]|uniref:hypothetical protein n=1 Tax=Glutamicibacter sp. TaxID=1931995 RepID=UPI002FE30160